MAKKWSEEMAAKAVELYTAKLESEGKEAAADNEFLDSIAKQVDAVSGKAARSKLTVMKVYVKPDAVASVAKTNTLRKEHFVRALANSLKLDADEQDSLKNAKVDALQALCTALGITDIAAASAKGYELETFELVKGILVSNGLDLAEVGAELEEVGLSE